MATLMERYDLQGAITKRVKIALAAALTDILRESAMVGTDEEKRRRRIRQRWAERNLVGIDDAARRVTLMLAAKAPAAQLADGLSDAEISALTQIAIDALAAVEFYLPDEVAP